MIEGSIVLGITVLSFAVWLHWNEKLGWPNERFVTDLDNRYLSKRTRARRRIHIIIATCGVLILIAAAAGPGVVWIAAWLTVMLSLMTVVILAGFDALRTHRYHKQKLPKIRRDMLGKDD